MATATTYLNLIKPDSTDETVIRTIYNTNLDTIDGLAIGNTNIVTVGTIATGTWEGTTVAIAKGGTGVNTGAMTYLTSILNTALYVGRDADNQIKFATDNKIIFRTSATDQININSNGDLDLTSNSIISASNADITIQPNGTGDTVIYAPSDVVTTFTGADTLTIAEAGTVLVSAGSAYTLTLPTASGHTGLRYHFVKTDYNYNLITLDGNGSETFNYENSTGSPNLTYPRLNTPCAEVTIVSDGTNWQVINEIMGQVPECEVYLGTNQLNITDDTWVVVDLDTEVYDIGSNFNTGTHQFTAPVSGKYQISAAILYADVTSSRVYKLTVREGGDAYDLIPANHSSSTQELTVTLSKQRVLAASEYIELLGRNTSGGNADYYALYTRIQVKLVSKD